MQGSNDQISPLLLFDFNSALTALSSGPGAAILKRGPSLTSRTHLLASLLLALLHVLLLGAGFFLLGGKYNAIDPELQQNSFLDPPATLGVLLVLAGCTLGPLAVGGWLLCTTQRAGRGLSLVAACALVASMLCGCLGLCAFAWATLIVPGETYHRGTVTNNQPDTLKQFLGGLLFAAYAPVTACCAFILLALARRGGGGGAAAAASRAAAAAPFQREGFRANWGGLALLGAVSAVVTFATALCTPVWNYSSTSYFSGPALDGLDGGKSWSLLDPSLKFTLGPPPRTPPPGCSPGFT